MAAPKKKRVVEENMETVDKDDDISSEEELGDDDSMGTDEDSKLPVNQEVEVEFEARSPLDSDFHGINLLLQQLFLKAAINLSELTNTVISQNYIGSVMKQCDVPEDDEDDDMGEDDDPVFGLITVINMTERQDLECVKQIRTVLQEKCQQCCKENEAKFTEILNSPDKHVGLLLSERFINIPPQISVPMFESLIKEMEKARSKKMKYDFAYFIMICKTYKAITGKKKKKDKKPQEEELIFTNSEEDIIKEMSELTFSYSVKNERDGVVEGKWDAEEDMEAFRTVLLIPADKLSLAVSKIKTALASSAS